LLISIEDDKGLRLFGLSVSTLDDGPDRKGLMGTAEWLILFIVSLFIDNIIFCDVWLLMLFGEIL
jgi:hypothetical protein